MLYTAHYSSKFGNIRLLSDDKSLLGLWFQDQKYFGASYNLEQATAEETSPIIQAKKWLDCYFSSEDPSQIPVPLKLSVTPFQHSVFHALQNVPYGQTITYKQLSDELQQQNTVKVNKSRAIGHALSQNPILLIIPCHRVIGSDGSLTGYAAGVPLKRKLLAMEKQ